MLAPAKEYLALPNVCPVLSIFCQFINFEPSPIHEACTAFFTYRLTWCAESSSSPPIPGESRSIAFRVTLVPGSAVCNFQSR